MKKILIALFMLATFLINPSSVPSRADTSSTYTDRPLKSSLNPVPYQPPFSVSSFPSQDKAQILSIEKEIPASETRVTTPDALMITLSFTGDCTLGDDDKYQWNTFDEVYRKVKDPSYFFSEVKSVFAYDDFTFVNFEGALTKAEKKAEKKYRFKGDPIYVNILKEGSIEGVTLANNHSLDYLEQGFNDTVKVLEEAGIRYTYFDTYFVQEIKGIKIGFLGYKGWEHEKRSNELLIKHVAEMRKAGVHYIVANYHWGDENSYTPNTLQKRMAHFAIDSGVDLVIGHHPHVLQGLEVYKGRNIVYSLGNFCFGGAPNPKDKDTIIYQQILTVDPEKNEIISTEYNIIPARVSGESERNNYQPVIAQGKEAERILNKFSKISEGLSK